MEQYDHKKIESKWQKHWEETGLYKTPEDATAEDKFYMLPQLPYPSGSGLHVGHAEVYNACDIFARYQRMKGEKVLQVIGWDSFGLPAENYAIKTNVHPRKSTNDAIDNFRSQIKNLGISVDWDREVGSHNPDYYKWTQWFFQLFYKRGLAYRKMQAVNWCDSCKTVLANAQVLPDGTCERCDTVVIQKDMEQWYIRITDYADKLLEGLDRIDWPEESKKRQRDWIGRSEGAEIVFPVILSDSEGSLSFENSGSSEQSITVFTTRPDNIFGATYMVLAPEHELISNLKLQISNWTEVEAYIAKTAEKTELDRQIDTNKTGVELQGIKAINPVNGEEIPVWIADYVLATYGTGAIMAVPAHDERDFEFAKKFGLEIREVVSGGNIVEEAFTADGKIVNSEFLNGLSKGEAIAKAIEYLEEKGVGKKKVQYKLRDWSVSRQRFWGAPVPMLINKEEKEKQRTFILIHGFEGRPNSNYFPALKKELEVEGHTVSTPDLPNHMEPNVDEQAKHVLDTCDIDEDTVLLGHSLGGPVVFRILEQLDRPVAKVILSDSFYHCEFNDKKRPLVEKATEWNFDMAKVKDKAREWVCVIDDQFPIIPQAHSEQMAKELDARLVYATSQGGIHFDGPEQPELFAEVPVSGLRPVYESDLPVILPDDVDFKPTGESPLNYSPSFQEGVEEKYGNGWKREVDTLDTFMCSSWYFFRYIDAHNDNAFASEEALKKWMPVDFYLGGPEHVNGHLLYSRFFTKVLHDAGYIDFDEPFPVHRHQGLILAEDNRKMSKRWGNVINPTDVVNEFGADTIRTYQMFMGPLEDTKPWSTDSVRGVRKFIERAWRLQEKIGGSESAEVTKKLNEVVKKVTSDMEEMKFNTAIAKLMELVNTMTKADSVTKDSLETFVKLLAPFAPHVSEELWEALGNEPSVTVAQWPTYDESLLVEENMTVVVQVNGKVRDKLEVPVDISEEDIKAQALASDKIQGWLDGKEPTKVIYVKGKLVSVVV